MGTAAPSGALVPSLRQEPGRIQIHLRDLAALLDVTANPAYPHTPPVVEASVARFLFDSTREQLRHPALELAITLDQAPLAPDDEARAREAIHRYFAGEAELAALDLRVNRAEGFGSLRYAIPLIVAALLIAGLFYTQLGRGTGESYLEALTYLVFITIVWIMMWDPLEMLLFNSYMIRRRRRAFEKLAHASIAFSYGAR